MSYIQVDKTRGSTVHIFYLVQSPFFKTFRLSGVPFAHRETGRGRLSNVMAVSSTQTIGTLFVFGVALTLTGIGYPSFGPQKVGLLLKSHSCGYGCHEQAQY